MLAKFSDFSDSNLKRRNALDLIASPVTEIASKPRGRPPVLPDLDEKLIAFFRARGGVININVVRATAKALISSNPSSQQRLSGFKMPRSLVHSIYKRMGLAQRMGTNSRPPVPNSLFIECKEVYRMQREVFTSSC